MTWNIASNQGTLTGDATNNNVFLLGTQQFAALSILFRFKLTSATADFAGAVFLSDSGAANHYRVRAGNGFVGVRKTLAGVSSTVGSDVATTTTAATEYWMRASISEGTIQGKVWADGTSEPGGWTITASDSSITARGYFGIFSDVNTGTDTVYIDSFSVIVPTTFILTPGSYYWQRFRVVGSSPVQLFGKVWPDGMVEPSAWSLTASD